MPPWQRMQKPRWASGRDLRLSKHQVHPGQEAPAQPSATRFLHRTATLAAHLSVTHRKRSPALSLRQTWVPLDHKETKTPLDITVWPGPEASTLGSLGFPNPSLPSLVWRTRPLRSHFNVFRPKEAVPKTVGASDNLHWASRTLGSETRVAASWPRLLRNNTTASNRVACPVSSKAQRSARPTQHFKF
jgi:hypothetical protein